MSKRDEKSDTDPSVDRIVSEDSESDDSKITCWCGAVGTFDELFDDEVYSQTCGGGGYLDCHCGGDFCVCHHHGEVECDGCADCEDDDDLNEHDYEYDEPG